MKKLLRILIPLLFLFSFFSTKSFAASTLSTDAVVNYSTSGSLMSTVIDINFKNSSSSPSVLNYYTILLPFQNVSQIKVKGSSGKSVPFTSQKQKSGTEVTVNTNFKVIPAKSTYSLKISFDSFSTIERDWSFAKLTGRLSGLNISKIILTTPTNVSNVGYVEGGEYSQSIVGNSKKTTITKITQPEVSVLFGNPITFEYVFNKTVLNSSKEPMFFELPLPLTNSKQLLILNEITPNPVSSKIDKNNNIILRFLIEPLKQQVINIKGYILKEKLNIEDVYFDFHTENIGYWSLTNQFEFNRINEYLKNTSSSNLPKKINDYVVERFKIDKSNISNTNSFENSLRGGADIALSRKDGAVPEDYNDFLISILRLKSVPSRLVNGYIPISSSYSKKGFFHSWVEYFDLKNSSWNVLDPSLQDSLTNKVIFANSPNYISLLVRGDNPLNPKLPFIKSDEISIAPTTSIQTPIFDVTFENNTLSNNGNIPVKVVSNDDTQVLLPGKSLISNITKLSVESFKGDSKIFENTEEKTFNQTYFNIFNESIIFFLFILLLFFLDFGYSKLVKIWKTMHH